ncbi:hypothetical protein [Priestia megaterium]|uniref:hypothetical protein n=1 Tax=Priestia megaterium TaxID=1404 RepID=UPI002877FB0A|nr:hypothetical protein [Priestia megaterium]
MRCNKCGNKAEQGNNFMSEGFLWNAQFKNIELGFGYLSKFDNETWKFTLCEECVLDMVKTFKHVPQGFYIDSTPTSIETTEQHQVVFNHWKETGEWEDLRFYTYEDLKQLANYLDIDEINKMIGKYHDGKPFLNLDDYEEVDNDE